MIAVCNSTLSYVPQTRHMKKADQADPPRPAPARTTQPHNVKIGNTLRQPLDVAGHNQLNMNALRIFQRVRTHTQAYELSLDRSS